MESEKPLPLPLTGEEVKNAILFKLQESLNKTCHLKDDNAYTSFSATIRVQLTLSDYGRQVKDNHEIAETANVPELEGTPEYVEQHEITVDPVPPNQLRVETDQPVPVMTTEDGKQSVKHLKYSPRKPKVKANG